MKATRSKKLLGAPGLTTNKKLLVAKGGARGRYWGLLAMGILEWTHLRGADLLARLAALKTHQEMQSRGWAVKRGG